MKNLSLCVLICLAAFNSHAQKLMNSTLSGGGATKLVNGHYVTQVVGQMSVSGTFKNGSLTVRQGFKQPGFGFSYRTQPVSILPSTLKDESEPIIFTAFPNPFLDRFTVTFSREVNYPTQLTLMDMAGNPIFEKIFPSLVKEVDVTNLGTLRVGQYILHITQNGKPSVITLIKDL